MQQISSSTINYISKNQSVVRKPTLVRPYVAKTSLETPSDVFVKSKDVKNDVREKVAKAIPYGVAALIAGWMLFSIINNLKGGKNSLGKIKFKNANSVDSAIKFGQEQLGVGEYKGFLNSDLDVINWINRGLVDVNNVSGGKVVMPKSISYVNSIDPQEGRHIVPGCIYTQKKAIEISREYVDMKRRGYDILDNFLSSCLYSKDNASSTKKISKLKKLFKAEKFNYKYYSYNIFEEKRKHSFDIPKNVIYHEMGHLQHVSNVPYDLYYGLRKTSGDIDLINPEYIAKVEELRKLFTSKTSVARSISNYAAKSPCEFVAECYTKLVYEKLTGRRQVSNDALELYKKLGGVVI